MSRLYIIDRRLFVFVDIILFKHKICLNSIQMRYLILYLIFKLRNKGQKLEIKQCKLTLEVQIQARFVWEK